MRVTRVRPPGLVVRFDHDAVQPRIAGGRLEPRRHRVEEPRERRLSFHADDASRAGRSCRRRSGRPCRSAGSARRRSARACACRRRRVTLPSRCQPIAIFSLVASAWKSTMITRVRWRIASISRSTTANGSSMLSMNTRPITLMTPTARPSPVWATYDPRPGHAGRVVGRAKQPRLGGDVVDRLLLVPDVIARRHHVHAVFEQRVADVLA